LLAVISSVRRQAPPLVGLVNQLLQRDVRIHSDWMVHKQFFFLNEYFLSFIFSKKTEYFHQKKVE
jgi:hypothetical protein